jgi:hypothetical protein
MCTVASSEIVPQYLPGEEEKKNHKKTFQHSQFTGQANCE